MKTLISGATGFIGSELCRALSGSGTPPIALSRQGAPLADGTATIAIDLSSQELDATLLQGVDVVFHLAGIAHQHAPESAYMQLNHRATLALARASEAAGVKCFIYLSSVKAMGAPTGDAARAEPQGVKPTDAYGLSKWLAEQDLQSNFSNSKMSVVILRPALVYGPGVKGNLLSMRRAVLVGLPRPPEVGGRSMIALQDLIELMLQIAANPPTGVRLWIVCDGHRYSARGVYDLMRVARGKGRGFGGLPLWVWKVAAFVADGMRHRGVNSRFNKLFGTELYSNAAITGELFWRPHLELADNMPEIMASAKDKSL